LNYSVMGNLNSYFEERELQYETIRGLNNIKDILNVEWVFLLCQGIQGISLMYKPDLVDKESGYVLMIVDTLPVGFRGLLLASFAAAFMSTISTQLNWGSSYLVNDFYKRFIKKKGTAKHYVMVSRFSTLLILLLGAFTTMFMDTISGAWKLLMAIGAGTGLVYILRWYWWRINAWSEISAMIASFVISIVLQFGFGLSADDPNHFSLLMILTVVGSSAVWITVTFLTAPEKDDVLIKFYTRVRPAGILWKKIYSNYNLPLSEDSLSVSLRDWILGILFIYCFLFSIGSLLFGNIKIGVLLVAFSITLAAFLWQDLKRL